ncbi:hypothetical protein CFIO01_13555 [Colletotrichum fioriniae PJ7]|uniref:Uncharacterized protein n=1 Tax=Colletotrichum fioriniae PJ7 TaxID=1445577 RepID=A0A010QSS1_9PEZI|nr:hypothetical protein CFIO01_13555 [Colletotrichum fioriniae PJ7]
MVPSSKPWDDSGSLKVIIRLFAWAGARARKRARSREQFEFLSSSHELEGIPRLPDACAGDAHTVSRGLPHDRTTPLSHLAVSRECGGCLGSGSRLNRLALSPLSKGKSHKYLPWLVREGRAEPVGRTLGRGNLGRRLDGRATKEGTRTARGRTADGVWFGGTLENWLEILMWARCGWRSLIASAGGQVDLIET